MGIKKRSPHTDLIDALAEFVLANYKRLKFTKNPQPKESPKETKRSPESSTPQKEETGDSERLHCTYPTGHS